MDTQEQVNHGLKDFPCPICKTICADIDKALDCAKQHGKELMDDIGFNPSHYFLLRDILDAAYHQAASGKGKERHATNNAWEDQPIATIGRMVGPGFNAGQAIKKLTEAMGMIGRGERDAAIREVLGAIVYSASVIMLIGGDD